MQNKNWYEYQPQIIAGVIGGIAFAAYRLFRGAAIGAAAGQGVFAGLLVFGVLCAISNAFNAQSQQDSQNLDRFIEEKKKEAVAKPISTASPASQRPQSMPMQNEHAAKSSTKVERKSKGRSIVRIPGHYTVVDTETTGLDPQADRLIEIAAIRVRAGKEVARFETLVKPGRKLSKAIVDLTGITDGELTNAPEPQDALQQFIDFLKDDIIVAHNANFDVNFLYDSMQRCGMNPLENNFVDTMRLAKCIRPDLSNYKLATLAKAYRIAQPKAHRALADCETTMAVLQKLDEDARQQKIDFTQIQKKGYSSRSRVAGIVAEPGKERPESPFYGKHCVFTGELDSMTRWEAAQAVVNIGGLCTDKVTQKTSYLIAGKNEFYGADSERKTINLQKAEELIRQGADLRILTEDVFLDMLAE